MESEQIFKERNTMVVLDVRLDNFYAFSNFHMNLTYPKKIVGSSIPDEHLDGYPNFRYKKVNVIMGANAAGKTTFGRMLMKIFNFMSRTNFDFLIDAINDTSKDASFALDMASSNTMYHIDCTVSPPEGKVYTAKNIALEIRSTAIRPKDSYESCLKRLLAAPCERKGNFADELSKLASLDWMFEYPKDTGRILDLPNNSKTFCEILENLLRALDPAIQKVEISKDVKNAYVVRSARKSIILQNGESFDTDFLSSGTKAGVEIANVIFSLRNGMCTFYYCDEKFPYIHSDIEKAVLSLMIDCLHPNDQIFFTTHNTDILEMDLPKHAFMFLRKNIADTDCPITCVDASSFLKRSTDSLKNAVENDLFSTAPSVDLIFAIANS